MPALKIVISSEATEVVPELLTALIAVTRKIAVAPWTNSLNSIEVAEPAAERLFPLLLSAITYDVIWEPPSSAPTSPAHETVAFPIPETAVGLLTARGNVVGVAVSEFELHGLASRS
jgi:hypothetical protein